ncbi:MAG: FAD-binding oxidoreductase [Nitrospira sp.]|nr:FAD-binding oxidoreductase [Nitrospira sp.]
MAQVQFKSDSVVTDLERLLGPQKVLSDFPTLTSYSIDASIYKITPQAVVLVKETTDLESVLEYARAHHIPLTARSAGTNLTGNAIGEGIILEFSGYNRILELNREEQWVRVQPGIIYAELNKYLERFGLMFAPDPSSGEMCKIGGMLGNNAAGPHTLKYGATKDNVLSMEVYLADGKKLTVRSYGLKDPVLKRLLTEHPQLQGILDLVRQNKSLIQAKKPRVTKNSSGYNLFALADGLDQDCFDLARLFVGSEGTLGLTLEATLRLVTKPARTATALIYFAHLEDVGMAVNEFLTLRPSAMEVMDTSAMDIVGRAKHRIPQEARALLLVEFDQDPIEDSIRHVLELCCQYRLCGEVQVAHDKEEQAALWKARKAIYPSLYRFDERKRPINFADDVVVPVHRLSELISYLDQYFKDLRVPVAIYGHIGDGNAHINPLLDINDPADVDRMVRASKDIHEAVIQRFGGSICGEHGDGRVRKEFVRDLYGDDLYRLFQETKQLLDPQGILNPGVKIDLPDHAQAEQSFTAHLDYERFTKQCATCGKCNSVCPAYDVSSEESNSARGWFHILTSPDYSYENSKRVVEACLNCKSCRVVCPAGIDVSEEVLKKRAQHPNRLVEAIFWLQDQRALFETMLSILGWSQPLWDKPLGRALMDHLTRPVLKLLASTARIPKEMILPRIAVKTLRRRYTYLTEEGKEQHRTGPHIQTVAYFHGCAANYFMDGVGDAVIRLLQRLGVDVMLPRQKCSGTPIQTYGLSGRVKACARFNVNSLLRYETIVTGCASCTLMLKDYPAIFNERVERDKAVELASRVMHITEFLTKKVNLNIPKKVSHAAQEQVVTYHSSCHLRAAGVTHEPRELLKLIPGTRFVEMQDADRCAGGAGTFIVKNYDLSCQVFERKRRAISATGADVVATSCPACMIQLNNGLQGKVKVKHVVELLEEALS